MNKRKVAVVSVEMGYGHLRAAMPLADALGQTMLHVDQAPFADPEEQKLWSRVRRFQELLSKPGDLPVVGPSVRALMDWVTLIPPLHGSSDLDRPNLGVRLMDYCMQRGLGDGLVNYLRESKSALVTTFYAPALIADRAGWDAIYCVVTDADCHRVWAPGSLEDSKIHYFAPSSRVVRRLKAYGVPAERITLSGFPLPDELLGGHDFSAARAALARRLVRLDPHGVFRELQRYEVERLFPEGLPAGQEGQPPMLTFAVGGAGAQAKMAYQFLPSLREAINSERLRVTLVSGIRNEVKAEFELAVESAKLGARVGRGVFFLHEKNFSEYYRSFNRTLVETDMLWTKPSELSFYAALGIPLILARPVGAHERFNRRWLRELGVALKQYDPAHAWGWFSEWLHDGTLAATAWSGFARMPKNGTYRIIETLTSRKE